MPPVLQALLFRAPPDDATLPATVLACSIKSVNLDTNLGEFVFPAGTQTSLGPMTFVLTGADGGRTYGHCLHISVDDSEENQTFREAICLVTKKRDMKQWRRVLGACEEKRRTSVLTLEYFMREMMTVEIESDGDSTGIKIDGKYFSQTKNEFPYDDIETGSMFASLSADHVLSIVGACLRESRILFISDNSSKLSACVHALLALIYPFDWQHVLIPILPLTKINYVTAPMPYIIGACLRLLPHILSLPLDPVVIVNLDSNEITYQNGSERDMTTPLPPSLSSLVSHTISKNKASEIKNEGIITDIFFAFHLSLFTNAAVSSAISHSEMTPGGLCRSLPRALRKVARALLDTQMMEDLWRKFESEPESIFFSEIFRLRKQIPFPRSQLRMDLIRSVSLLLRCSAAENKNDVGRKGRTVTAENNLKFEFQNGDTYQGEWKNGLMEGPGLYTSARQQKYEGQFFEGERHGAGRWKDIERNISLDSVWHHGLPNGWVRCTFDDTIGFSPGKITKRLGERGERGEREREEGATFDGWCVNGVRHGEGVFKFPDGVVAELKFSNGKLAGDLNIIYPDGEIETMFYLNGKKSNFGNVTIRRGVTYQGSWRGNVAEGDGELFSKNETYSGQWRAGFRHGLGKLETRREEYNGQWACGLRWGEGEGRVKILTTSEKYISVAHCGEWVAGVPHGVGCRKIEGLCEIMGTWRRGVLCGSGNITGNHYLVDAEWDQGILGAISVSDKNGVKILAGNISNGSLDGPVSIGVAIPEENDFSEGGEAERMRKMRVTPSAFGGDFYFVGNYSDGLRDGPGAVYSAYGEYFRGWWREGAASGEGELSLVGEEGRSVFNGNWVQGLLSGNAKHVFTRTRRRQPGEMEEDKLSVEYDGGWVAGRRQGRGVMHYPLGEVYEGEFSYGMKHGKGTLTWPNAQKLSGLWHYGRMVEGDASFGTGATFSGSFQVVTIDGGANCTPVGTFNF